MNDVCRRVEHETTLRGPNGENQVGDWPNDTVIPLMCLLPATFPLTSSPLSRLTRGDHPPTHNDAHEAMYHFPQIVRLSTYCYCLPTINLFILGPSRRVVT